VLKIFSYAFTCYSGHIIALQPTSIGFLKIDTLQYMPFTSKSFLTFLNSCGLWRNLFEEKRLTRNEGIKFAALEPRRLALSTAA